MEEINPNSLVELERDVLKLVVSYFDCNSDYANDFINDLKERMQQSYGDVVSDFLD